MIVAELPNGNPIWSEHSTYMTYSDNPDAESPADTVRPVTRADIQAASWGDDRERLGALHEIEAEENFVAMVRAYGDSSTKEEPDGIANFVRAYQQGLKRR